jgi:hypothetical protein
MEKDYLLLKRASASRPSGEWNDKDYDVLANGVVVGRICTTLPSDILFRCTPCYPFTERSIERGCILFDNRGRAARPDFNVHQKSGSRANVTSRPSQPQNLAPEFG